jgi:hypothetical protein
MVPSRKYGSLETPMLLAALLLLCAEPVAYLVGLLGG